mgnify:FL=1
MQGKVIELFITLDDTNKTRKSVQTVSVDNDGILEDKFHGKNLQRSVLLTATDSYVITQENNIDITTGSLGENILIDINPYHLVMGDIVVMGSVELEITQNCTLCKGLSIVDSKLPKLLKDDRGIFAKVISGKSTINVGDKVTIVKR